MAIRQQRDPGRELRGRPWRRTRWPVRWPLAVMTLGFPVWWLLGLGTVIPVAMAVVMADQLLRRRRVRIPPGFGFWALFLVWVALGALLLWADAPGAVPGGGGPGRLLVFGSRLAWYLTLTVVLLWVGNLEERELPARRIRQYLGYLFVVTAAGGLLGVLIPHVDFPSVLELVLPRGMSANAFVRSQIHPGLAEIQDVLGRPEPRPRAPFEFANSWGSNFSLFLPFFLVAWLRDGRPWQRVAAPVVLAVAAVPVVYSLNRGLWASLALGACGLVLLQVRRGSPVRMLVTTGVLGLVAAVLLLSPLGQVLSERMEHQHSNERREQLLTATVESAASGSPVVGFGSTRDVQGSFASIAGASTPNCEACGVPPLGTQGHIWLVIFSQGFLGAALLLAFLAVSASRSWRCRTTTETLCAFVLGFLALQLSVYDTLGMPMYTVMVAVACVWREQRAAGSPGDAGGATLGRLLGRVRDRWALFVVLPLVGASVGGAVALGAAPVYASRVSVLLAAPPTYLSAVQVEDSADPPRGVTVDTEAALVVSEESLRRVTRDDPAALQELARRIRVTAPPNTTVLTIEVRDSDPGRAERQAAEVAQSYLTTRRGFLTDRRDQVLTGLRQQVLRLAALGVDTQAPAGSPGSGVAALTRGQLQLAISRLTLTPTDAGEVIRTTTAVPVRRQAEVQVVSGAALGFALASLLVALLPRREQARGGHGGNGRGDGGGGGDGNGDGARTTGSGRELTSAEGQADRLVNSALSTSSISVRRPSQSSPA